MFLKSEAARQIKCTVYRSAKFLQFFVRFDQILYIFFEKLSASGGLRPPDLLGLPPPTHSYVAAAATETNNSVTYGVIPCSMYI